MFDISWLGSGAVAAIRLNRPPANAIGLVEINELEQLVARLATARTVRAALFYTQLRFFSAGADIELMGAKGAVIAVTKSLAREMARYSIKVNCVCPGPTDTPLFHANSEKVNEALVRAIPFRRVARPEEIAGPVAFFASDEASYVTGQVLSVSGGLTMVG
jgi:hypothetical protein